MDYLICGTDSPNTGNTEPCPHCRRPGLPVKSLTVASLVKEEKLPLPESEYFLCVTPQCPVAYYNDTVVLEEKDLRVPVWFKDHDGRVAMLKNGRLVKAGTFEEVFQIKPRQETYLTSLYRIFEEQ